MNTYTGTKTLKARPMTRGEYHQYRNWEMPEGENPEDAGYLVEYEPGSGKKNDERHEGYISWSPVEAFEKAYRRADTFLERLRNETQDLAEKLQKLVTFTESEHMLALSPKMQALLAMQRLLMTGYHQMLEERRAQIAIEAGDTAGS